MDCTHVKWLRCKFGMKNYYQSGRYPYPTIVFQIVVDHTTMIYHVSDGFRGKMNDIQVTEADTYPRMLMKEQLYKDRFFTLINSQGIKTVFQGGYLITDGGYPFLACFMDPSITSFDADQILWSE